VTAPTWLRATLLLTFTFAAGLGVGVAYTWHRDSAQRTEGAHSQYMIQHLARELDLDSTQRAAVTQIFARRQRAIDSTWQVVEPHVHATIDSTLREIASMLRPDQSAKYRKMLEEHHPETLDTNGMGHTLRGGQHERD
jgi:hypothetical protein